MICIELSRASSGREDIPRSRFPESAMHSHFPRFLAIGLVASLTFGYVHAPQDPAVKQLATERYNAAKLVWELRVAGENWVTLQDCDLRAAWSRRLAESAAASGALASRAAFAQHLSRMQDMLTVVKSLQEAGRRTEVDAAVVEYYIAEAKLLAQQ